MTHDKLLQQAERMRNNLRDWIDDPGDNQARQAQSAVERLISDIKAKKSREAIDNDLKQIMSSLRKIEEEAMDHHHSDKLFDDCEDLRREARNL